VKGICAFNIVNFHPLDGSLNIDLFFSHSD
jgi:hypothetical protein